MMAIHITTGISLYQDWLFSSSGKTADTKVAQKIKEILEII